MCNCEVLPMTTVMPNSIGVYPDGKPVYYDPEKAAEAKIEKLKKLTEDVKTEASKPKDIVTVSYASDYIKERTKPLEFSPDRDTVELGNAGDKIIDIRKPDDDYDINNNEMKTMDDLQDIQKVIFQHRKGCYAIPECIYNICKDNDEDRAYRAARM